jgi:hypothetical protein
VTLFIPGKLENPLNGPHGHWSKRARWAKIRKEKAELCILFALKSRKVPWPPELPKQVTFTATVWNVFDDDGLTAAIKPYRDACKSMGLINDDRPSAGHKFVYEQRTERKLGTLGVTLRVEPLV